MLCMYSFTSDTVPRLSPRVSVPKPHMLQTISACLILVASSRSHGPLSGSGGRSGLSQPQALAPSTVPCLQMASIHTSPVPTLCLPPKFQELSGHAGPSFVNVSLSCLPTPATDNCHRDCTFPSCSLCLCSQMRPDGTDSPELISTHGFCPQLFRTIILL